MPTLLQSPEKPVEEAARRPLYEVVREQLRQQCLSQGANAMLPPLRQLSAELNVNHLTVSRALRDLESDGIVEIVPRKGIYIRAVTPPAVEIVTFLTPEQNLAEISGKMFRGMQEVAGAGRVSGTTLTVPPFPNGLEFVQALRARGTAAVVMLGFGYLEGTEALEETRFIQEVSAQLPVVLVGKEHTLLKMDSVYCDARPQMRSYLEECYAAGARRFGFLGAEIEQPHVKQRYEAFRDFLLDHGIAWERAYIPSGGTNAENAAVLLSQSPPPEVVVSSNISRAYGLILEAQRRGLQPGQDIKVMCFASSGEGARTIEPYATVVLNDEAAVGRRAMQLLHTRLRKEAAPEAQTATVPAHFLHDA